MLLRRMTILLLLDGMFCVCLLDIWSSVWFKSIVSLLTFALNDLSIDVKEVLNFLLLLYCCQFLTSGLLIIALWILVFLNKAYE